MDTTKLPEGYTFPIKHEADQAGTQCLEIPCVETEHMIGEPGSGCQWRFDATGYVFHLPSAK